MGSISDAFGIGSFSADAFPASSTLGTSKIFGDKMGVGGITGGVKKYLLGGAEKEAGRAQQQAQIQALMEEQQAIEEMRRQTAAARGELGGFQEAGARASRQEQALMGLLGPEEQQAAIDAFTESPGQKFLRESAEQAVMRQASATGGLGGGQVLSALQEQAIGIAGQSLADRLQRLSQLRAAGQQAAGGRAQLSQELGRDIAGARTRIGNRLIGASGAQASGMLGEAAQHRAAQEQFYQRGMQIGDRIMSGISGGMGGGMGGGISF